MAKTTEAAFQELFSSPVDAMEFQNQVLSIGREYLPPCALAVLDGQDGTDEYWTWLAGQVAQ